MLLIPLYNSNQLLFTVNDSDNALCLKDRRNNNDNGTLYVENLMHFQQLLV